tara:strand:- start:44 stop:1405 length:1362 start_codon:yes stop_codon:yes gene_type:complete
MNTSDSCVKIVGGGLAGAESAWQVARLGLKVHLYEMRPTTNTEVHQTDTIAELVCSNSFRSDDKTHNAVGVLHEEMRRCGSIIMLCADQNKVPAGSALAVDRIGFSKCVEKKLSEEPLIQIIREEIQEIPEDWKNVIIATGPLTAEKLSLYIASLTGTQQLAFFDAIAPIVYKESIDFSKAWFQSRYDKGEGDDYINCPVYQDDYLAFIEELTSAETIDFQEWERNTPYFDGCLPIEVMAERGQKTLAYGPMKPVGLTNPHSDEPLEAVIQLRQDNALGTLYNMVGFQTKLKHSEQVRIFRKIPGLENAKFARLGGLHRNTFINAPKLLDRKLRLKNSPQIRFAGQITGCEGYVESAAIGLIAGIFAGFEALNRQISLPPPETALGALLYHITGDARADTYQPMNINFGLFPDLNNSMKGSKPGKKIKGRERKSALAQKALQAIDQWNDSIQR